MRVFALSLSLLLVVSSCIGIDDSDDGSDKDEPTGVTCSQACQHLVDGAPCYAEADGMSGCMEDCSANLDECPEEMYAVNACIVKVTVGCDDTSLQVDGCMAESMELRRCSGRSPY